MGEGPDLTYAFSTPGLKKVVLKVTNATRTHGFAVAGQVQLVQAPEDESVVPIVEEPVTPPDPVDPPPPADPAVDEPAIPAVDEPAYPPGAGPTE